MLTLQCHGHQHISHPTHILVDLYVSMSPLAHPTRENFTWFHSSYGADSLTIQYEDIYRRCRPDPEVTHGSCEFRLGMSCVCVDVCEGMDVYEGMDGWMDRGRDG